MLRYLLAAVLGLASLVGSVRGCIRANSGPAKLTCANAEKKVAAGEGLRWVQLSECEADVGSAVLTKLKIKGDDPSAISRVYIPLRSTGAGKDAPALMILRTSDAELKTALGQDDAADILQKLDVWAERHDFEGWARDDAGRDDEPLREQLVGVADPKALVIEHGKPRSSDYLIQFGITALLLGYAAFGVLKLGKKASKKDPEPPAQTPA